MTRKAIVVEVFDYRSTRIVVTARYLQRSEEYLFIFLPQKPVIVFGDILEVDQDSTGEITVNQRPN